MEILIPLISGGVVAAFVSGAVQIVLWKLTRGATKEDAREKTDTEIKNALRILLYDRIKHLGRRHIAEKSICAEDLEDLMAMHKIYHDDLDGNGFLDDVMLQVRRLNIRVDKV